MRYLKVTDKNLISVISQLKNERKTRTNKRIYYYEIPCSFDIETSSFYVPDADLPKRAIMYIWQFAIRDTVIYGRTWDEFQNFISILSDIFNTSEKQRLIIYVHNLAYEFQFIRKLFSWSNIFAIKERKPIKAVMTCGIEFRCSLELLGYSLKKVAENLSTHKIRKLVGDLDYDKIRTPKTELTREELQYCFNDVLIVTAYIDEYMKRVGSITLIPLTKTGAVRELCRQYCFYGAKSGRNQDTYKTYRKYIDKLRLQSDEYKLLKECFSGGFTHASAQYVNETLNNVHSMDFTSSYPYVMLSEKFPCTKPQYVDIHTLNEANYYFKKYNCIFRAYFYNIREKFIYDHYISKFKCRILTNSVIDNGRVAQATEIEISLTEIDFLIIQNTYDYDYVIFKNFYIMERDYLPRNFIKSVLDLYESKTTLKGVKGKKEEYLVSKENLNSTFGMIVTDICRDEIVYENDIWKSNSSDVEKAIHSYNTSKKRFLYYPWGVYITAYARRNLWTAIMELKNDYVYSDTDSVKYMHAESHEKYFNAYNNGVISKLRKSMNYYGFDFERCKPKTIRGCEKLIGVWDDEGEYSKFKTLGAKRYMVEKNGEINITVSGLNKQTCVPYLIEKYGDNVFRAFNDGLYIPPEYTGKKTHTYFDDDIRGIVSDYNGEIYEYYERSGVHLGDCDYNLSMSREYINYLLEIKMEKLL